MFGSDRVEALLLVGLRAAGAANLTHEPHFAHWPIKERNVTTTALKSQHSEIFMRNASAIDPLATLHLRRLGSDFFDPVMRVQHIPSSPC